MATWPSGIYTPLVRGTNLDDAVTHTDVHDGDVAEIVALEQSLGVGVKGAFASVAARLDDVDDYLERFDYETNTWTTSGVFNQGVTTTSGTFTSSIYTVLGKVITCHLDFVLGGSSAITADVRLNLPVTAAAARGVGGDVLYFDDSTGAYYTGIVIPSTTDVVALRVENASGTYTASTTLSNLIPMTWAGNDRIIARLSYMAA
jgi:tetrahydromethanopterin S-methyltransferase subunit B